MRCQRHVVICALAGLQQVCSASTAHLACLDHDGTGIDDDLEDESQARARSLARCSGSTAAGIATVRVRTPATRRPATAAAAVAGAAMPATVAAAARKTAPFLVLRMFQGSSRGWDRLAAFASKALSRGGAGPSTNTRSKGRMFNQPGEGSELARLAWLSGASD